jgi:hypothetical protein
MGKLYLVNKTSRSFVPTVSGIHAISHSTKMPPPSPLAKLVNIRVVALAYDSMNTVFCTIAAHKIKLSLSTEKGPKSRLYSLKCTFSACKLAIRIRPLAPLAHTGVQSYSLESMVNYILLVSSRRRFKFSIRDFLQKCFILPAVSVRNCCYNLFHVTNTKIASTFVATNNILKQ